jgi:hypothetical protein
VKNGDSRRPKAREVSVPTFLRTVANVEDFERQPRAELPAALPAPPESSERAETILGEPLALGEVGRLIGCSAWTVRQKYVPLGLPHLRSGPNGKLIFYKNQVIRWLLERQRKGVSRT